MSKIVFICFRNFKRNPPDYKKKIDILSKRLFPDNISPRPPKIINNKGVIIGIFNPAASISIKHNSVCMGHMISPKDDWWKPKAEIPDGSYALFRSDKDYVELISDVVASRTVWYIKDKEVLIASSSQRAIVFFLQSFQMNGAAISWMLSSGSLGPELSWDKRIRCVGVNACLLLNRESWDLTIRKEELDFHPKHIAVKDHESQLKKLLSDTFECIHLDYSKWILPLSGGFDSRAILLMLRDRENLKCVTWGLKASLHEKGNDAYIARALAAYFNLNHRYYETNISDESTEKLFKRFLVAGEGRIDHISGYMDGFKIWKGLFEEGFDGIIRGDECFGSRPILTSSDVRRRVGAQVCSDFSNLKNLEEFGFERQVWPENLQRKAGESLSTWRDRLYRDFRVPSILAALTDLKLSYVEVINPFLSAKIIDYMRKMPDSLRTNKRLFKKIVHSMNPQIEFARYSAINEPKDILKNEKVVAHISSELNTDEARTLLPHDFIDYVLGKVRIGDEESTVKKKSFKTDIKTFTPVILKNVLRNTMLKQQIDFNVLAFRAYIVFKMKQIFDEDAAFLKRVSNGRIRSNV